MSHELRTPLNAILGFAQLLDINEKDQKAKENIHEIIGAGNHLLSLINEILDLSKIESGKLTLIIEEHCLNEIVEQTLSLISPLADQHSVQIDNQVSALSNINIHADEIRFKQVLLNIISNAIKYNKKDGKVIVSCLPDNESMLHLSITDTGNGLTEKQQGNLFKPFERFGIDDSHIEGTGLGLVISKEMIELMGGAIVVESEVGKGTCFKIKFPLAR